MTELRYGYTLADLNRMAQQAANRAGQMANDHRDRYDTAWSAIAEALYSAPHWPQRHDLIRAGQRAIWDMVNQNLHHDGYYLWQTQYGPGSSPAFVVFWVDIARVSPSPEHRVVEHLSLYQILPRLTPRQRDVVLALAAHGDYRAGAEAIGLTYNAFVTIISGARRRFLALWHEHETPSRPWGRDGRRNNSGAMAASDIRSKLRQRRCKAGAKARRANADPVATDDGSGGINLVDPSPTSSASARTDSAA